MALPYICVMEGWMRCGSLTSALRWARQSWLTVPAMLCNIASSRLGLHSHLLEEVPDQTCTRSRHNHGDTMCNNHGGQPGGMALADDVSVNAGQAPDPLLLTYISSKYT